MILSPAAVAAAKTDGSAAQDRRKGRRKRTDQKTGLTTKPQSDRVRQRYVVLGPGPSQKAKPPFGRRFAALRLCGYPLPRNVFTLAASYRLRALTLLPTST